jgi:polyisoprenoid-binding protein YceI
LVDYAQRVGNSRSPAFVSTVASAIGVSMMMGCAGVPRAELTSASPRARAAIEAVARQANEVDPGRYVVRTETSRLEVTAKAAGVGSQTLRFDKWRAWVVIGEDIRVVAEIDMRTLHAPLAIAERLAKYEMLEVDRYPRATFIGVLHPRGMKGGPAEIMKLLAGQADVTVDVAGTASIHGRVREVKFVGRLRREDDGWGFRARFKMARGPFDVRLRSGWDRFVDEDVTLDMDLHARQERVSVEPVEDLPQQPVPDQTAPPVETVPEAEPPATDGPGTPTR